MVDIKELIKRELRKMNEVRFKDDPSLLDIITDISNGMIDSMDVEQFIKLITLAIDKNVLKSIVEAFEKKEETQ